MVDFGVLKGRLLHLLILVGLIIAPNIPVHSSVSAQSSSDSAWVVRSIHTGEYGINKPKGLAYSPVADTLLILGENANVALVTMGEDNEGIRTIPELQYDPQNVAFDSQTNSLFEFDRGKSELVRIATDEHGLPDTASGSTHISGNAFGIRDPQGVAFDPATGRLFILDAGNPEIVAIAPHPTLGFDADEATRSNKVERISLKKLGIAPPRGIAYNPSNGHFYVAESSEKKLYELTQAGDVVSATDLAALGINDPSAMTFAPSGDNTDDPSIYNLFILDTTADSTQAASSGGQVVELSLVTPESLPAGTTLVSTSLVRTINTSKSAWTPSAPDTSGIDYWPLTGRLLISDSEVDEMSNYFTGKNVYEATLSGSLVKTCSTTNSSRTGFSNEPTGLAINPTNNRIYFTDDDANKVNEVALGPDNTYCTSDDVVTSVNVGSVYNIQDAEDIAFGNNTLYVAGGDAAEIYIIPLGANKVLGGGDDGPMTHFDTYSRGFRVLEGLGYNRDNGTLLLASAYSGDKYIGEMTITGTLLRAYDLNSYSITHREDVTFAPGSQNSFVNNFYISDRGIDNDNSSTENDGKIWEVRITGSVPTSTPTSTSGPTPTPTNTSTPTPTSTSGPTPTPTNTSTPTPTSTSGPTPTPTNTLSSSDLIFADGFESGALSAWTASVVDAGDLSVTSAAALVGAKGLQAVVDDTNIIYVTDDSPSSEPRYRARFYFDPNSIVMASGDSHGILYGYVGTSTAVIRGIFCFCSGAYQIQFGLLNDSGTWQNTSFFTISDAKHPIEIDWQAATAAGANNGSLTLWIDGAQKATVTGVDNDTRRIDRVRIGGVFGIDTGTHGTYYFDDFVSRRQSYIGP